MPDIVLSHGYFLEDDEKEQEIMRPYPPLGILYISSYLKKKGFDVDLWDSTFLSRKVMQNRLRETSGIIGLYTTHMTRTAVVWLLEEASSAGWTVILGGPDSANYPAEYLDRGADIIVLGEGEETLAELLPALQNKKEKALTGIPGIVFKNSENNLIQNAPRDPLDIDTIPWPDREGVNIDNYIRAWTDHHQISSLTLITARGCPYHCRWCSHAVFGNTLRKRDYLDCAEEVTHLKERYNPGQLWYADDVFTIDHAWLFKYARELKRRSINIPFETISRADRMLDEGIVETLADMGCYRIWIGSESGSNRILKAMERGVTAEQVRDAVRKAKNHGIETGLFLMWGYEGEHSGDIEKTVEHIKKSQPDIFFTTMVHPIMNTPYYNDVEHKLKPPAI